MLVIRIMIAGFVALSVWDAMHGRAGQAAFEAGWAALGFLLLMPDKKDRA